MIFRKYTMCPFPVLVNKFDNNISSWMSTHPCTKSGAVKAIFQKTNILELNDFTVVRISCEGGKIL